MVAADCAHFIPVGGIESLNFSHKDRDFFFWPGMVVHASKLSTREAKAGRCL